MAKQPYIPFYFGDYITDTRKLPLAVRGAWMDLLLFMWNEKVRGELTGTMQEFAGLLSCSEKEADFAVRLLIEKNVCDHEFLPGDQIRIISRRMKKDVDISTKRSKSGQNGVEAKKLKQQNESKYVEIAEAKQKQKPEYEYIYDNEIRNKEERGVGKEENGWVTMPAESQLGLNLPKLKRGAVRELFYFSKQHELTDPEIDGLWSVFKKQHFTGGKFYGSDQDVFSHFINWSKTQNITNGKAAKGLTETTTPTGTVAQGGFRRPKTH
jgi:uncharacterized protein YdaU (DUF1376 family)